MNTACSNFLKLERGVSLMAPWRHVHRFFSMLPSKIGHSNPTIILVSSHHTFCQGHPRFLSSQTRCGKVPSMGESITEGVLSSWKKNVAERVKQDELIAVIDTDKVSIDIQSVAEGILVEQKVSEGDTVSVGDDLYVIDLSGTETKESETQREKPQREEPQREEPQKEEPRREEPQSTPVDKRPHLAQKQDETRASVAARHTNEEDKPSDVSSNSKSEFLQQSASQSVPKSSVASSWRKSSGKGSVKEQSQMTKGTQPTPCESNDRQDTVISMTRLRLRIAERLKQAQNTSASLTTFNECDMSKTMAMRAQFQEDFMKTYGIKLGFMSSFLFAASRALMQMPDINAHIASNGVDIVYKNYADISVAVSTPSGLLVPVIRDCHKKSIPVLEQNLYEYTTKSRTGKIALEDMAGGSFTISNGGIFGSLMGTPILNPPQSAILGLHAIKNRPIVVGNDIVVRPMMYLALTYDHRLVDGREAVTFLNVIKNYIEEPTRMLLEA